TNNYGTITQFKCKNNFEHLLKGLKLSERSWTCPECGTYHDRDFNATCNIKEFGLKALPSERGKVKPVDCPTVDDRPRVLKSRDRKKQEKRGGIGISEAAKSLV
ncbi:MAG: zinc ribbon domain-containing protein, partial [Prevotellamassilia sp.]|nr:zinc ribbon domain-containing protein [Prevotellamassilia sp.]